MTKMFAPEVDPVLYEAAQEVARSAAHYDGPLCLGPRAVNSAVFYDGIQPNHTIAVRVQHSAKPEETLARVQREVTNVTALRENGALVQCFIGDAQLHAPSGIVGTVCEYLPQRSTVYDYGRAIGTLHTASTPEIIERLPLFDPLTRTEQTYTYLRGLYDSGQEFAVGGVVLPPETLDTFSDLLDAGQEAIWELLDQCRTQGLPLVALQQDVNPSNVLADRNGQPQLIDLDYLMQGPAVCDLTRPYDNWQRFQRDPKMADDFLEGYFNETRWPFFTKMMKLALRINYARYTSSLLTKVVERSQRGHDMQEVSAFYVEEAVNRINSIKTGSPWRSEHEWNDSWIVS